MTRAARALAALAVGAAIVALGLVALPAAQLWKWWNRCKTRRLLGLVLKQKEQQQRALSRSLGRAGAPKAELPRCLSSPPAPPATPRD